MSLLDRILGRRRPPANPPSYTNASVIQRISQEQFLDVNTARRWFYEMLIFLDLCAESDKPLAPPPAVDHAWHAFVLHTRDYEAYCMERFGRIIHHEPTDTPDARAYRRAYKKRRAWGKNPDYGVWGIAAGTGGWFGSGDFGSGGDFGGGGGDGGGGGGDGGGGGGCAGGGS